MRRTPLIGGPADRLDLRPPGTIAGLATGPFDGVADGVLAMPSLGPPGTMLHAPFFGDRGVTAPERRRVGDEAMGYGAGGDERDDLVG